MAAFPDANGCATLCKITDNEEIGKWMFGIEGWNEGFDLLRISLGMEFP